MRGHNLLGCKFMKDHILLISSMHIMLPQVDLHQPHSLRRQQQAKAIDVLSMMLHWASRTTSGNLSSTLLLTFSDMKPSLSDYKTWLQLTRFIHNSHQISVRAWSNWSKSVICSNFKSCLLSTTDHRQQSIVPFSLRFQVLRQMPVRGWQVFTFISLWSFSRT